MNNSLYHYTKGIHLLNIISDGVIKLSRTLFEFGEIPCVALTTNSKFEKGILPLTPTTEFDFPKGRFKPRQLPEYVIVSDLKEASSIVNGFYRFQVDNILPVISWDQYKKICSSAKRFKPEYFFNMEKIMREQRSTNQNRFYLEPIFKKDWIEVEKYDLIKNSWEIFTREDFNELLSNTDKVELSGLSINVSSFNLDRSKNHKELNK
jgi:hypothetical protein